MSEQTVWMRSGDLSSTAIFAAWFRQLISLLVTQVGCKRFEFFVDLGLVHVKVDQSGLKVQLLCSAIPDGVLEAVPAHVSVRILLGSEGVEGVLVDSIDRSTSQAEEKRIGQGVAHLATQVTLLGAVRLIHQHDDVAALVQHTVGLAELVDCRDDDLADVTSKEVLQVLAALGP